MNASLRQRLTYWLVGPLLLLVAAGSFVSYRIAFNAATKAYDSALLDPVLAIASHIRPMDGRLELDLPSIAIEVYISRLRSKLQDAGITIRTVRGFGYMVEDPDER